MLPTIDIGPLVLPTAGLIVIIGAWLVLSVSERAAKKLNLDVEATYTLVAILMAAAFIGARFVFVILHWPTYKDDLLSIFWPLTSGFNWWAGLVAALIAGLFYGRAKQLPLAATLDALSPGLILTLLALSLADFAGGPGYGQETSVPWAIDVFGIQRHPVQLYEIAVAVLALVLWLWSVDRRRYDGQLFLMTVAFYAGGRLLFDAYRANSPLTAGGYHIVQIASLAVLLLCVFVMGRQATQDDSLLPEQQQ